MRSFHCLLLTAFCLLPTVFAQVITTVAGSPFVFRGDGGLAKNAPLGGTRGVAADSGGNIFVTDVGNEMAMRVSPAGVLTVVAGNGLTGFSGDGGPATSASLNFLLDIPGIAVDQAGNLYIADPNNLRVRKVSRNGTITTVAGGGRVLGDGGPATEASLDLPQGVAVDAAGNLYIADTDHYRVRKVGTDGVITTVAGKGTPGFSGDGGPATAASLDRPAGVAVDAAGNLYIADTDNDSIRKVGREGTISTVALRTSLSFPVGVAVDAAGNLYIADTFNARVLKVTPDGTSSTVAGNGLTGFSGDGGPATNASLNFPSGIAVDAAGNLYVADYFNRRVRKVGPDGVITSLAGNGLFKYAGDNGPAASAALNVPSAVAVDSAGNLYIADRDNQRVRKVGPDGTIVTLAGNGAAGFSGDGGPAGSASLNTPVGVAADARGNIYVADRNNRRIRKVASDGTMTTVAGDGNIGFSGDGGPATAARMRTPAAVTADAAGSVYIADTDNQRVRKVSPDGIMSTAAGNGVAGFSGDGGPATSATFRNPSGVAADAGGNLYIGDRGNRRVRKVSSGGTISTVAGNGVSGSSGDGGPATSASVGAPEGVAADAGGNLYIADTDNYRIRKVNSVGIITTVAGNGVAGFSGDGALATSASIRTPGGVAVDAGGNLYIADKFSDRIRKVLAAAPSFFVAPASLKFSAAAGAPAVAPQLVAATSTVPGLGWSASGSASWLAVSPTSGAAPGLISAGVNVAGLAPGTYRGTLTVQALLAATPTQTVAVELAVLPSTDPQPELDRSSITFETSTGLGNPPAQTLRISNSGAGTVSWTARPEILSGGNWLSVSPASGTASAASPAVIRVSANTGGLPAGVYSALVRVESPSSTQPHSVAVDLLLSQVTQTILLTQTALQFTAVEGGEAAARQNVGIVNTGQGEMSWTARTETVNGGNWLSVSPSSGRSDAASPVIPQVEVGVNVAGLRAGSYAGLLRVDAPGANNSPRLATVSLNVLPAGAKTGPQLRPPGVIFSARAGTSSPSSQTVRLITALPGQVEARGQALTFKGGDWLEALPTNLVLSANDPRTVVVQPKLGDLAPGEYRGALTFQFSDGSAPQAVDIFFLVVGGAGTAGRARHAVPLQEADGACSPQKLVAVDRSLGPDFTAQVGAGSPLEVQVIDDCGNAVADATVVANFSSGDPPLTLTGLRNGTYTGTWRPANAGSPVVVTLRASLPPLPAVELLTQGRVDAANVPAVFAGGIVNAASFAPGAALAPGSIVSVFGRKLASTAGATSLPLPKTLGGATLQVGGTEAPLFYSSDGQINAQLPFEVAAATRPQVVVKGPDFITVPETITIAPARPGIFTLSQDGKGQGAILDGRGRVVDANAPAAAGDVVAVYCTGLGATQPAAVTGQAAPSNPLALAAILVTASVGGISAPVQFAGLAPGFVGLYQVNVQIPSGVTPGGAVPLALFQNGVPSNTVTLAVR